MLEKDWICTDHYIEAFVDSTHVESDRESNDEQKEMDADYKIESRRIAVDCG